MKLKGGFFCCGIQMGVSILGWIFLISHTAVLMSCFINFEVPDLSIDSLELNPQIEANTSILAILLSFNIIGIIANISLLYSNAKGRHLLLLPWLVTYAPVFFLMPIFIFIRSWNLSMGGSYLNGKDRGDEAIICASGLSFSVLFIYCWLSVLNLYKELSLNEQLIKERSQDDHNLIKDVFSNKSSPPPYTRFDNLQSV